MNTINWSLVLLDMTRRAGHNQICVHQILLVSWYTRLWNINPRHVYITIRQLQGLGCPLYENSLPNKGNHLMKSHGDFMDFTCFSRGLHSNTFRNIILKGFNWIITKWRTQSHSYLWAIQHKSPLNIQYINSKYTTTKCILFTTSPDHIN